MVANALVQGKTELAVHTPGQQLLLGVTQAPSPGFAH